MARECDLGDQTNCRKMISRLVDKIASDPGSVGSLGEIRHTHIIKYIFYTAGPDHIGNEHRCNKDRGSLMANDTI